MALRITRILLVTSLHLLHTWSVDQAAPVDPLLNKLTLLQPIIFIRDCLLFLFVYLLLLCFVLLDAFDLDLEGSLDGILKHEVPNGRTALEIFSKHLIGFIKLRACKKTEICVNAFCSNFGWHSTSRSGRSSFQPSWSSRSNYDPLLGFPSLSNRKIVASQPWSLPLWASDLVGFFPLKISLWIGSAAPFLYI